MNRIGSKFWLLFLLVAAGALAVGWMVWLQPPPGNTAVPSDGERSVESSPASVAPLVEATEEGTRRPTPEAIATPVPTPGSAPSVKAAVPATVAMRRTVTLIATFTLPDHSKIRVERARVDLIDSAGVVRRTDTQQATSVEVPGLAPGTYTVRVDAQGYEHREQTLDLAPKDNGRPDGPNGSVFEERLVLWPADWIAVLVETSEGHPFSAMAEELGLKPMNLFAGAFQVHTRLDAPVRGETDAVDDSTLARFRPPPEYKSWELTRSCIGSLQLLHPPPLWVGLDVFGTNLGWELLSPGRREVVFHLDPPDLEARFARLTLRVVDPTSRSPVAQALVTLRADDSAHRRKDQSSVPTGSDGRVELVRIVPGGYELEVFRGESQHQEMLELRPGEHRDLGDVPLGTATGFEVLVVDARGEPVSAPVEIGPYRKGARNCEIYPQMMRHQSDPQGRCHLPMQSDPVMVRAAVEIGRSNGPAYAQEVSGVRSANVLVDPGSIPPAPIRLQLESPSPVHLTTSRPDGTRFEVLDELDVIVARSVRPDERALEIELVPGNYRVRGVASDGSASPEVPFSVGHEPATIALD